MNKDTLEYANGLLIHSPIVMRPVADDHWVRSRHGYRKDEKAQVMELVDPVTLYFSFERETWTVRIKEGYVFDGASIPKIAWTGFGNPWDADVLAAALVHDIFYAAHPVYQGTCVSKLTTDQIFRQLCKYLGMGIVKRNLAYLAVREFGKHAWCKDEPYLPSIAKKFLEIEIH